MRRTIEQRDSRFVDEFLDPRKRAERLARLMKLRFRCVRIYWLSLAGQLLSLLFLIYRGGSLPLVATLLFMMWVIGSGLWLGNLTIETRLLKLENERETRSNNIS